jgi:hypothetical protein
MHTILVVIEFYFVYVYYQKSVLLEKEIHYWWSILGCCIDNHMLSRYVHTNHTSLLASISQLNNQNALP